MKQKQLQSYELALAASAALILTLSTLAWWFGDRSLHWAVDIAEPTFLGLGTLSIILLWAEARSEEAQKREERVQMSQERAQMKEERLWRRVLCFHEHFPNVPAPERSKGMRELLSEMSITDPPSAYLPLSDDVVARIMADKGSDKRSPAKIIVINYLNGFEQFCGAVRAGVVDENYARELRGSRVIDAYFGYKGLIDAMRKQQEEHLLRAGRNADPFKGKIFAELQKVAVDWHAKRKDELKNQQLELEKYDLMAAKALRDIEERDGVSGVLK